MGLRIVLVVAVLLSVGGCSTIPLPSEPSVADSAELFQLQLDTVWHDTGLDDALRPEVAQGEAMDMSQIGLVFAGCMMDRGWSAYFADENSASYRSLSEAANDAERRDWYQCFAAHPMSNSGTLASIAQYDYLYDYFQEFLIPCLQENGYTVSHVPTRNEFRTRTGVDSFLFAPIVWNPYYSMAGFSGVGSLPVEEKCPAQPPEQDFYVLN